MRAAGADVRNRRPQRRRRRWGSAAPALPEAIIFRGDWGTRVPVLHIESSHRHAGAQAAQGRNRVAAGGIGPAANMIALYISDEKPNLAQEAGANRALTAGGAHDPGSTITCRNSISSPGKQERHAQIELMLEEDRHAAIPIGVVVRNELEVAGSCCAPPHLRRIPLDEVSEYLPGMSHCRDPGIAIVSRFLSV